MNVARIAALRAGLPVETSAMTINRFCSSGLQAIALAADRVRGGGAEVIVAGGTESMSMVPMGGNKISPNPWLVDHYPDAYINMGLGTENIARKYGISREAADQFAMASHQKAIAAIAAGKFKDETLPVEVKNTFLPTNGNGSANGKSPKPSVSSVMFDTDELPRADTSLEVLAKLKPAFHVKGSVTAGNSSPMSDGAAAVVVMSDARAKALGIESAGTVCGLCYGWLFAGRIRHRPGQRNSQSPETCRSNARRYCGNRIERGIRRAIARSN